jgi:putative transposase
MLSVSFGDIIYLPTEQGWLHLATVIDLHTREIVGPRLFGLG